MSERRIVTCDNCDMEITTALIAFELTDNSTYKPEIGCYGVQKFWHFCNFHCLRNWVLKESKGNE
jgi:hypothetical protein